MRCTVFICLIQCIIVCNRQDFVNSKALVGQRVRQAIAGEFPSVVALIKVNPRHVTQISRFCTGTLVSRKDVLTADHCLVPENISHVQVSLGSIDFRTGRRFNIAWWMSYNKWAEQTETPIEVPLNDIAMIRLTENVSREFKPATLSNLQNTDLYGLNVKIAGWGRTNTGQVPVIMEMGSLTILTHRECAERISRLKGHPVPFHSRLLCSAANPYIFVSRGDSGNPILYNNTILGVSSGTFRDIEVHPDKVNVHFSVRYYRNFIQDIKNNF